MKSRFAYLRINNTRAYLYLVTGIGVFLCMVFIGEEVTPMIGMGLIAAIIGIAAINMPKTRKCPPRC